MSEQPPPYPGYPPPPQYGPLYGPPYGPGYGPPPYNTYAILSLVFALAVFAPLGIYFGAKAKRQIAQTGERGIELATAGYVCGWVFSALLGLVLVVWCGFAALVVSGSAATGG
jgi:hypothetical protein